MPQGTTKIALTINYGVEYKIDPAIVGEVSEILGEAGISVFAATRTSYVDGVAQVLADVFVPTGVDEAQVQGIAQAAIEKKHPGSVPEKPEQSQAEVLIEDEKDGLAE